VDRVVELVLASGWIMCQREWETAGQRGGLCTTAVRERHIRMKVSVAFWSMIAHSLAALNCADGSPYLERRGVSI
jgi:hypothetical protein